MFRDIEPWKVVLREYHIPAENHEELVFESLSRPNYRTGELVDVEHSLSSKGYNKIHKFIETYCIPKLLEYACDQYNYKPLIKYWNAWVRHTSNDNSISLHQHARSHISAVYYLDAAAGDLTLVDPRGTASRGYPFDIINNHFKDYKYKPETGKLIIFPSYLMHYVQTQHKGLRIAIPIDLFIKE